MGIICCKPISGVQAYSPHKQRTQRCNKVNSPKKKNKLKKEPKPKFCPCYMRKELRGFYESGKNKHLSYNKKMNNRNHCSPLRPNQIVRKMLDIRLKAEIARSYFKWAMYNLVLLSVLLFDISNKCRFYTSYWYWIEYFAAFISAVSLVACLLKYFMFVFCGDEVKGTEAQKILLTDRNDSSFSVDAGETAPLKATSLRDATSRDRSLDSTVINWHSSFENSNWSYNRSPSFRHSPSPSRIAQGKQQQHQNMSLNNSSLLKSGSFDASGMNMNNSFVSQYAIPTRDDFIQDPRMLNAYLAEVARRERRQAELPAALNQSNARGSVNSFWNYCNSAAILLKTSLYQLSPQSTTQHKAMANEDGGAMHFIDTNSEVIQRITTDKLSKYIANLRMWISTTILQRLVEEFENVNQIFRQRGLIDIKIGAASLDRLRKTAENQQFVNQCAPMLPVLLSFLDLTNNQEYLVRRIKDLAKGSCIANFCWNSGGDYNGQKWSEHLPTDTAILFHLVCVYLDSQLMPLPQGGGRPFHSRYVLIKKDKRLPKEIIASIHNKAQCAILCVEPLKPKLNFISDKEIHACAYDRNNLFYVIIHFLIYMRAHQSSTLEGINLGKGGINIMCVIDD